MWTEQKYIQQQQQKLCTVALFGSARHLQKNLVSLKTSSLCNFFSKRYDLSLLLNFFHCTTPGPKCHIVPKSENSWYILGNDVQEEKLIFFLNTSCARRYDRRNIINLTNIHVPTCYRYFRSRTNHAIACWLFVFFERAVDFFSNGVRRDKRKSLRRTNFYAKVTRNCHEVMWHGMKKGDDCCFFALVLLEQKFVECEVARKSTRNLKTYHSGPAVL